MGKREEGYVPIANMVSEIELLDSEDSAAVVVSVIIHVKSVDIAVSLVIYDDSGGDGIVGFAVGVRAGSFDPFRVFGDVVLRGEVDIAAELVEVIKIERRGTADSIEVYFGDAVGDLGLESSGIGDLLLNKHGPLCFGLAPIDVYSLIDSSPSQPARPKPELVVII